MRSFNEPVLSGEHGSVLQAKADDNSAAGSSEVSSSVKEPFDYFIRPLQSNWVRRLPRRKSWEKAS